MQATTPTRYRVATLEAATPNYYQLQHSTGGQMTISAGRMALIR